jgi:TolB-like protein/DNA-binding winged helix-turn-helix (wHTH) protein/tetratricopeptide (TPR) repeat protein
LLSVADHIPAGTHTISQRPHYFSASGFFGRCAKIFGSLLGRFSLESFWLPQPKVTRVGFCRANPDLSQFHFSARYVDSRMIKDGLIAFEFGPFRLCPQDHALFKDGIAVDITPQMFTVLLLLVRDAGHLWERERLIRELWPDTVVGENNLSQCIYMLRKTLGDGQGQTRTSFIETVPRRGYRFVAPVRRFYADSHKENAPSPAPLVSLSKPVFSRQLMTSTQSRASMWFVVLLAGGLFGIAAVGLLLGGIRAHENVAANHEAKSVAVLPFRLLTANSEDEYLSLGLADAIITKLSETRGLKVRPINAVRKYSGVNVDVLKAGRELTVGALLEGTVQRDGEKIRVSMRLVDTGSGASLWADQIDCRFADVFAIEDEVTNDIGRALAPGLRPKAPKSNEDTSPEVLNARQDYMKGRFYWSKRTGQSLTTAIQWFRRSLEHDPKYARAYAGIADSYTLLGFYNYLPAAESYPKAREAALQALAINDKLPEPHVSLANIATDYDWDWNLAEKEFDAAIALNPEDAEAYQAHAYLQLALGQPEDAARDAEKALQLDPLSPGLNSTLGWVYYLGHDYSRCLLQCRRTKEMYPDFVVARQLSALAYTALGQYKTASLELEEAQRMSPGNPMTSVLEAQTFAAWGRQDKSRNELSNVVREPAPFVVPAYYVAAVYSQLGRNDEALSWLEKAYAAHSNWLIYLGLDPRFDRVRMDPRFPVLLQKIGIRRRDMSFSAANSPVGPKLQRQ